MFDKNKMSEILLTKANMFILFFTQRIIEFVWQGERKEILQATIFSKQKWVRGDYILLECEYSASVYHEGALVEVRINCDLHHVREANL